ncbi:Biotin carboxylase 2, chloroplastic, partial [Linum perenne]
EHSISPQLYIVYIDPFLLHSSASLLSIVKPPLELLLSLSSSAFSFFPSQFQLSLCSFFRGNSHFESQSICLHIRFLCLLSDMESTLPGCRSVTSVPGLFVRTTSGIRSSQCSFLVGTKVNFPRQRVHAAAQVAHKTNKRGGALRVTCREEKILVANRGEIAVRVIRTAHELGIPCVAVYSTIDKDALHVKLADESVCIGEAPSNQSYLVIANVLSAAVSRGCTMLHPGYGFLAENATFVEMCREHGINFIGPNPDSIRTMGDKSTARETMKNAGVPTVPGSDGLLQSTEEGVRLAEEIGYPVMIKATAGGGGRGMRLAKEPDEFVKLLQHVYKETTEFLETILQQAKSEAAAAFGNDGVYLEKYVQNPRHIEFQVLADKYGNVIHFGERDCSIQRRNQKLLEEAPSPALTPELRKAMAGAKMVKLLQLIVWAPTREKAIERMKRALNDTIITGVPTTIDYHKLILEIEDFKTGNVDTAFIPKHEDELQAPTQIVPTNGLAA